MGQDWLLVNLTRQHQCKNLDFNKLMTGLSDIEESPCILDFMHLLSDKSVVERGDLRTDCWIGDVCMYISDYHERNDAMRWEEMRCWHTARIPKPILEDYSEVLLVNVNRKEYVSGALYNIPDRVKAAQYTLAKALCYLMVDMTCQGKGGGDILQYNSEFVKSFCKCRDIGYGCQILDSFFELDELTRDALQTESRKTRIMGTWESDLVMVVSNDHSRRDIPQIDEIVESWTDISLEVGYNMWWSGIVADEVLIDKFKELDTKFDEMVVEKIAFMLWMKELKYAECDTIARIPIESQEIIKWTSVSLYSK
eukprot:TRINITY_DN2836_c0_g5_i1.p1 TRINITY_DN2836_c0_g5~~TRINITY_DN2836_c0_g5_i1.p1  ORF type:complete len:310 (+),score=71.01 TRINITY_DN2836_c0_g5_i1:103-1032(+)